MKNQEVKNIIGSLAICNTASINIHEYEYGIDDYVIFSVNNGKKHRRKLYYVDKGIFFRFGARYYLEEFMMVG